MDAYFDCENICRACLINIENIEKVSLFDEKILLNDFKLHEALEACTSVHITYSDKTSIYLCDRCFKLLEKSYEFRVQCLLSEEKFKNLLHLHEIDLNFKEKDIKVEICKTELTEQNNDSNFISIKTESPVPDVKIEDNIYNDHCTKSDDSEIYNNRSDDDYIDNIDHDDLKSEINDDSLENTHYTSLKNEVVTENIQENTVYKCTECNKVYKKAWMLDNHKLDHGHNCKICFKSFDTEDDLTKHAQEHANLEHKKFVCKECGVVLSSKYSLNLHTRNRHTGEKPHLCSVCGRGFAAERYLTEHMLIHNGEKPFACNVCDAKFRHLTTLKSHLTTHTNEKNYICTVCGKKLAYKATLRIHMLSHTGVKKYPCTFCDKTFKVSGLLSRHMIIHSGEKNYKCLDCGKAFGRSHHLQVHRRTHTGEKPYICSTCGRGFTQLNVLKTHMKIHKE